MRLKQFIHGHKTFQFQYMRDNNESLSEAFSFPILMPVFSIHDSIYIVIVIIIEINLLFKRRNKNAHNLYQMSMSAKQGK